MQCSWIYLAMESTPISPISEFFFHELNLLKKLNPNSQYNNYCFFLEYEKEKQEGKISKNKIKFLISTSK